MVPWRILWKAKALFLAVLMGCASIPRGPRVEDTGQGNAVVHVPRTADLQPGTRTVILGGVTFPLLQVSSSPRD